MNKDEESNPREQQLLKPKAQDVRYDEADKSAESDFTDYLAKLEEYENLLAEGKVKW